MTLERLDGSRRPARVDGYDPVKWLDSFRASLQSSWRAGTAGSLPCACPALHVPPMPDDLADWPPHPRRGKTDPNHGWLGGSKESGRGRKRVWESDVAVMRGEFAGEVD